MYYGYCRKSTVDQNETSFEVQAEFLTKRANDRNEKYVILTETGSGGSLIDRPVFMKLLSELKEGDIVGCYDQSRISRNDRESFVILDKITSMKAQLEVNGKIINPNDPQDRAIFGMQSIFANYQKDIQIQKTKEGLKKKYINGDAVFAGDLFGYELIKRGKNNQVLIIEEEAKIIRYVFERYANGVALRELERELLGSPTSRPFNFDINNLRYMVQRPIYMGYYLSESNMQRHIMKYSEAEVRSKLVKSNLYPPIIDENLWWKCFLSYRQCKRPHAIAHCYRWIKADLSGIYKCAGCRGGMTFHNRFRSEIGENGKAYPQYEFHKHTPKCSQKNYTAYRSDWLEELSRLCFRITFLCGSEIGRFFEEKANELYKNTAEIQKAIEEVELSIRDIDLKISRLVDAVADGIMDNETIKPKMEKLRDEKEEFSNRKKSLIADLRQESDESDMWLEKTASEVLEDFDNKKREYYLKYVKEGLNYHSYLTLEFVNGKKYVIDRPRRTNFHIHSSCVKVFFRDEWQFTFSYDFEKNTCKVVEVNAISDAYEWAISQYQITLDKAKLDDCFI